MNPYRKPEINVEDFRIFFSDYNITFLVEELNLFFRRFDKFNIGKITQ